MRAFEFRDGEIIGNPVRRMIVDLDCIVSLKETWYDGSEYSPARMLRTLTLTDGPGGYEITEEAFDRILAAWKSK